MSEEFGLVTSKERKPLPLKDVAVEAEIRGYVLGLQSTLKYENDSTGPLEVVFRFPLEQSHAVVGLTAVIDGRKIRAELKAKEEAKMQYDDAIASGQTAALGEEKSGDIFSISLGNLPPQKEAEIVLKLVGELPIDAEGGVRFSLPATLKPRYTPAGSTDPLAKVGGADEGGEQVVQASVPGVQKFKLSVLSPEDVDEVTSPTHSIAVKRESGNDAIVVALSDENQTLASDLVILVKHNLPHSPKALVESGEETGKDFMKKSAVMINFCPELANVETLECEFIFLVDRSGSMSGPEISSARETLLLFLKSLPEDCRFNVIGFGSSHVKLFSDCSVPYSQATLDEATSHAQKMQADLGGTELLPPLKEILHTKPPAGFARQVFVLTDGSVSNTSACVDIMKQNISHSRCFSFGIGSGASTSLVEGLARAGNGSAEFIKSGERMQPKVIRSLKRAMQPAVTNVAVKFDLKKPKTGATHQCPDKLPPVFAGEKLVVYGLVDAPTSIEGTAILKGEILGKPIQHKVPFEAQPSSSSSMYLVHRLAAKALISDWQDSRKSENTVISLSIESGVVSSHTAFIAVDEENSKPVEGALRTWDIQSEPEERFRCMAVSSSLACSSASFNSAPKMLKKKGGGLSGMFGRKATRGMKEKSKKDKRSTGSHSQSRSIQPEPAPALERLEGLEDDEGEMERLCVESESSSRFSSKEEGLASSPKPRGIPSVPSPAAPTDILSSLVATQQADGSWQLSPAIFRALSKSKTEVEDVCPVQLLDSTMLSVIWATILVLTILESKCKGQRDEWELIAMKAEKWLKKQTMPDGVDVSKFYTAARDLL